MTSPKWSSICSAIRREVCRAASRFVRRNRRRRDEMSALDKHRDALEVHETMMGQRRGRLAVAMDLLTDALAMIGQHTVYCQSSRMPGRPTLDIEQIGDAKELVQTVIEQKPE